MHHVIKVVFRTIKNGADKGAVEAVYADIPQDGFTMATDGGTYQNEWYTTRTRPATPEEYAPLLSSMNHVTFGEDTYEFISVRKRTW